VVATFTDVDTVTAASDLTATIDWGDGSSSSGLVSGGSGTFAVSGSHTYATAGQYTLTATLADDAPGTATASATSNVTVFAPLTGQVGLTSATEHVALTSGTTVATFTDTNTGDSANGFTASINWGDGTTTAGTVSGAAGAFAIAGGPHT